MCTIIIKVTWDCPIRVPSVNAGRIFHQEILPKNMNKNMCAMPMSLKASGKTKQKHMCFGFTVNESKFGFLAPIRLGEEGEGEIDNHKGE